jgi:hypothetical protein
MMDRSVLALPQRFLLVTPRSKPLRLYRMKVHLLSTLTGHPQSLSERLLYPRGSCRSTPPVPFPLPRRAQLPAQRPSQITCLCPPRPTPSRLKTSPPLMGYDVPNATRMALPSHRSIRSRSPPKGTTLSPPALCTHSPWNESGQELAQKMAKASTSPSRMSLHLLPSSLPPPSLHANLQCRPESPRLR